MVWIPFFHFKAEFLKESNSHSNQLLKKMKQNLKKKQKTLKLLTIKLKVVIAFKIAQIL